MVGVLAKTTPEERQLLRDFGFIHVTGLKVYPDCIRDGYHMGEINPVRLGTWNYNNGKFVIVTRGGEVWLADGAVTQRDLQDLLDRLCPAEPAGPVPCSNGEKIDSDDLIARLTDPDWQPNY